jgi:hypothetical protein
MIIGFQYSFIGIQCTVRACATIIHRSNAHIASIWQTSGIRPLRGTANPIVLNCT